jgi:hypothetical protein
VLADYNVPPYLWQGWESAKIMVSEGGCHSCRRHASQTANAFPAVKNLPEDPWETLRSHKTLPQSDMPERLQIMITWN